MEREIKLQNKAHVFQKYVNGEEVTQRTVLCEACELLLTVDDDERYFEKWATKNERCQICGN